MNVMVWPTVVLLLAGLVSFAASFREVSDTRKDRYWVLTQALMFAAGVCGVVGMVVG